MSSGVLSQEEIDALLKGGPSPEPEPPIMQVQSTRLSDVEKDAIGEIANISMGSAATALSTLLGRKVEITTPRVGISNLNELQARYPRPFVVVNVEYTSGINGSNLLIIKDSDASIIVDLMMGGDGKNPTEHMEEMQISAVAEAMNQMMGSAATAMSTILSKRVDISPPKLDFKDFSKQELQDPNLMNPPEFVTVAFQMVIEDLIDSEIMQLIPLDLAISMVKTLMGSMGQDESPPIQPTRPSQTSGTPSPAHRPEPIFQEPPMAAAPIMPPPDQQVRVTNPVSVQPVQFTPLRQAPTAIEGTNIDILMDVPLQITVELGRAKKTIRDILGLAPGSVIELDKIAGEPVDLMVNGKLLAKGEVVVIDENFGIRVTDIISPMERVANLQ